MRRRHRRAPGRTAPTTRSWRKALANEHLYHRGATGADADTGDGAGILIEMPDAFLRARAGVDLPPAGQYGVAVCFLPHGRRRPPARRGRAGRAPSRRGTEGARLARRAGRPRRPRHDRRRAMPAIRQLFVGAARRAAGDHDAFERKLYVIRRQAEKASGPDLVIPSFSSRTLVYKGMLTSPQLARFYPDLRDEPMASRWRSCTRASRRTRSPAGSWPTRTGWSPTTARSTR